MSYKIKEGVSIHCIDTKKFKTNLIAVFLTTPLSEKTVTFDTMIPAILKRGTQKLKTQEEINIELENMYGAVFDCGIDKIGDNHVLKFYLESLNDNYIPEEEKMEITEKGINLLLDIIFNPYIENGSFKEDYVKSEKINIERLINSKIDNKDQYALNRCIEEMYKGKPYGLYKYGNTEDLNKIDAKNLFEYYKNLINTSKIDIFVSGDIEENKIIDIMDKNENLEKLSERDAQGIIENTKIEFEKKGIKTIEEKRDVTQGKLVLGCDVDYNEQDSKYAITLYNVILGESATSKLFQNVREKASLAYTARSNYVKQKNNIYIRCGIEIKNYEKALEIIKKQLKDMENGDFTRRRFR